MYKIIFIVKRDQFYTYIINQYLGARELNTGHNLMHGNDYLTRLIPSLLPLQ